MAESCKSKVVVDLVVNRGHHRTLIVCPLSVISVWPQQFELHAATPVQVLAMDRGHVQKRLKQAKQALDLGTVQRRPVVLVVNYEAFWREPLGSWLLKEAKMQLVVLDESHRVKSPGGKASRFATRLGQVTTYRMCLTGTPMPHSPLDVYAQYRYLDPEVYGWSFARFRQRYAVMADIPHLQIRQVVGFRNLDDLHEKFYRIAYRVRKSEVLDLPPELDETRTCQLEPEAARVYRELSREFVAELEAGRVTATNALTKLLRLQQITSGYLKPDDSDDMVRVGGTKQRLLSDVLEDLASDEPLVVFCRFRHDLDEVARVCEKADVPRESLELSGRVKQLAEWQAGEAQVLAVQIQAGGVGVDLTRAAYAVYYSIGFSLGDYAQSRARLHRPGQERPVTYIHLITERTVDVKVMRALSKKRAIIESVLHDYDEEGADG